jgi:hypothetical protein
MSVTEFEIGVQAEYIEVSKNAIKILIPLATSYLYETRFSAQLR